jgi:hypothetical protein
MKIGDLWLDAQKVYSLNIAMKKNSRPQWWLRADYAKFFSRSHDAVICVYDGAGNVIETHEEVGEQE